RVDARLAHRVRAEEHHLSPRGRDVAGSRARSAVSDIARAPADAVHDEERRRVGLPRGIPRAHSVAHPARLPAWRSVYGPGTARVATPCAPRDRGAIRPPPTGPVAARDCRGRESHPRLT